MTTDDAAEASTGPAASSRPHLTVTGVVGLTLGVAALCAVVALHTVLTAPPVLPWQLALLLCMLPLSELALVHIRFGGDSLSFTWGEGCLLVGFGLVSPAWLVLLAGPTVAIVHLLKRRGLQKAAFNGAAFTISAAAAALVVSTTKAPYQITDMTDALALTGAALVFSFTSGLCTGLVVSVAQGKSLRQVLLKNLRMFVLVSVGNLVCAGTVLFLAERSRATLLGVPPVMLAVFMVYRGYLRASQERDIWRQLEAASRELNHLDGETVASAVLLRARELFRTNDVDLLLHATDSKPARVYALEGGELTCSPIDALEARLRFADAGTSILQLPAEGARKAMTTSLLSHLEGPQGTLGTLRLHFNGPVTLSDREHQVLGTFTHAVATTLLNVALHEDVRAEAAKQAHYATHDPLTGLANRLLLRQKTTQALADGACTALLLIDLDHFKEINDTLGHAAGDVLLQQVARRLLHAVRREGLVARLGGDEFAILLTDLEQPSDASYVAERILAELSQTVDYQGLHLAVEGSIGVACYPQDAQDAEELFRRADVAMYQAKADRGSWLRYDSLRDDSSIERLALVADLRAALERHELVVHYQQKRDLGSGSIIGAEALVRWQHPVRGLLQPGAFVGVAEQSGLVRPFTLRVLELAVAECVTWPSTEEAPLSVAVNLGARSLLDRRLPEDVAEVLNRYGLAPSRLVLEITETTATSELEVVEDVLGRLRRLGVEISVDDFGTGYSSLSFLQRTAVHELKVDRSFVSGMLSSDNDLALVRATIQLAHSLGARAVGEGVESQALLVALTSLGCDVAQGFHLGRPVPAEEFRACLHAPALPVVPGPRSETDRHLSAVSNINIA